MTQDEALEILTRCRQSIDDIDIRILALINERTLVVEEIGRVKQAWGFPIYEPKREDQVFENVTANNQGPLSSAAVHRVFERIIDEMRGVQRDRMLKAQAEAVEGTK